MVTAQEITVALRSDGTQEVASDVGDIESEFEETAGTVGESADELAGFSAEFGGAMSAIVAGFAVAAAGLLAQVPVVGGLMESLAGVLEAVAFQMDQVLRPVLMPVTDFFHQLSTAIFEADGVVGTLIGAFSSLVAIGAIVAGVVLSAIGVFSQLGLTSLTVGGAITAFIGFIKGLIAVLVGAISWPVLLGAALVALAFIFRDEIADAIDVAIGWLKDFGASIMDMAGEVWDSLGEIAAGFADWASDLISDAIQWGKNFIDAMIQGIKNKIGELQTILSNIASGDFNISGSAGGGGSSSSGGSGLPGGLGGAGGATAIDGRRLDESTGRYGKDRNTRRSGF